MNTRFDYNNKYNAEHYARISALIPKDKKQAIEDFYKAKGFSSMSEFINYLIRKEMESDSEQ